MCKAWQDMDQVTIAAVEGHCIGGGAALVVALDFRFCGKSAHFRIPEVELGMNMSWGSIPRLLALMGPARTKQAVILASIASVGRRVRLGPGREGVEDGQASGGVDGLRRTHRAAAADSGAHEQGVGQPPRACASTISPRTWTPTRTC
jgi:enoyl-CoA hydratase/carnithine racemase